MHVIVCLGSKTFQWNCMDIYFLIVENSVLESCFTLAHRPADDDIESFHHTIQRQFMKRELNCV